MILRELTATAGDLDCWAIISQIEHAQLARDLAARWDALPFTAQLLQETILPVIAHHDDGWADWDSAPQVDPATGRPYSFLDMPLAASLDIWTKSIGAVLPIGPLAPWIVAQHFMALLGHSENAQQQLAQDWLNENSVRCEEWFAAWQASAQSANAREVAQAGLATLQYFDRLSLWFCCRELSEPLAANSPTGHPVRFRHSARGQVLVSNWPFQNDGFTITVAALKVEARQYASQGDLAITPHEVADLNWQLVPW